MDVGSVTRADRKAERQPQRESVRVQWDIDHDQLRCAISWDGNRPELAAVLPQFEHLGLLLVDHRPISDSCDEFVFRRSVAQMDEEVTALLAEAFVAAWDRRCDSDDFARLVPAARLRARQVQLVRVAFAYLRQAGLGASRSYVAEILLEHPDFVRRWVEVFEARFIPGAAPVDDDLDRFVDMVVTRDEDRVLSWYTAFVRAVRRTNYCQRDRTDAAIAVKLDPAAMPVPVGPGVTVETFVYHPDVEGLHVRCGPVARGGLRWSDRMEDYRAEVLALVRAQQVKNAPIVPAGAKGAFVVKHLPADPTDSGIHLRRCYRIFVRGLLDVTDNLDAGVVVHPADTVILDADDPYLVVAADKGTAAFSDLANAESAAAGFWLDDAFASGGSTGYDHKRLGVTARGAWVSVRRHFAEFGLDVDTDEFTVAGIGDMSGDVFGNGMLLSRKIRLVAAFDHRHVFIDPDPGPEESFVERQRIAGLPGSSWADYDPALISAGGGVFDRRARAVPLSEQVRARLDVEAAALLPDELIKAILRSPVDLLWNGGIGTYVKSSRQDDAEVGDRANQSVRVDADQLRCRVVAEGGNLGLTQAARIEYALRGGRVNADFIDNAAGVNTSDREVNLKILLRGAVQEGRLTMPERDRLLAECSQDVVAAAIEDNRKQTMAISIAAGHGATLLDRHDRVMRSMEDLTGLDRARERLPDATVLAERRSRGQGLTRPELAVLLSHAKNLVHAEVLASDLPTDPGLRYVLRDYFPAPVRKRFAGQVNRHPLAAEIVATRVANDLIDRIGPGFLYRLEDRTGAPTPQAMRAYLIVRDVFSLELLWDRLDSSDRDIPFHGVMAARRILERVLEHNACWLLRRARRSFDVAEELARFRPGIAELLRWIASDPTNPSGDLAHELIEQGLPDDLARQVAAIGSLLPALDLTAAAADIRCPVPVLAEQYHLLGRHFDLAWMARSMVIKHDDSHWAQLAKSALRDEMTVQQRILATEAVRCCGLDSWLAAHEPAARRVRAAHADLAGTDPIDVAALTVAVQVLRDLVHATAG
ncbi:MAG: NAD-glutamate dehydrogenase domain-containing protein [Haloechinothrix sp.]